MATEWNKSEKNTLKSSPPELLTRSFWNFIISISMIWVYRTEFWFYHCSGCHGKNKPLNNTYKSSPPKLLARFLWNFIYSIRVIMGTKDTEQNFEFINFLIVMTSECKNLTQYLKILSSKTTGNNLMKLYKQHQCDMGNKQYRTELWFILFLISMATERINLKKRLNNILLQINWPDAYDTLCTASGWYWEHMIQNGILISSLYWLLWQPKEKTEKKQT